MLLPRIEEGKREAGRRKKGGWGGKKVTANRKQVSECF